MKIYNLGSLNIDYVYGVEHFVQPGETISSLNLEIFSGGKGLNQSVALARAGAKVILFSGANHKFTPEYLDKFLNDAQPGDILLMQNETTCLKEAFEKAHNKNMQIAFNPSPFGKNIFDLPLSYVDWWFCNEIEGMALFGSEVPEEIMKTFSEKYPESNLILTLGKQGSVFKNKEQTVYQPIYIVKAVDTTAAGDTFTGYFLAYIADGKSVTAAMDAAALASSITVSRKGAAPSIPYIHELNQKDN